MIRIATSALFGGLLSALVPIVALLLLEPARYGLFSIVYLIFAFGLSVQYSSLSEAWARNRRDPGLDDLGEATRPVSDWAAYSGMLLTIAFAFGIAATITAYLVEGLRSDALLLGGAVLAAVYRNGARYFAAAERSITRVLISDIAGIVTFTGALALTWGNLVSSITIPWLVSGIAGSVVLRLPRVRRGSGPISWVSDHKHHIRPLLVDSLLMDAGAIGTPFLLAGFMGPTRFGVYRAVSNVALPVRLLIDPLRPILGRLPRARVLDRKATTFLLAASFVLSGACFVVLLLVVPAIPVSLGTLSSLTAFAVPCSIFVIGSLLGTVYYIVCRAHAPHSRILLGRVVQTLAVIALPLLGAAIWGLSGAIWGFTISSCLSAAVWASIARARATPANSALGSR